MGKHTAGFEALGKALLERRITELESENTRLRAALEQILRRCCMDNDSAAENARALLRSKP